MQIRRTPIIDAYAVGHKANKTKRKPEPSNMSPREPIDSHPQQATAEKAEYGPQSRIVRIPARYFHSIARQ
jgi:hypothetical protein